MKLFDHAFYLRKYPDVAAAKVDPWRHYVKHGAGEGRKPHPLFDPEYYLRRNPEARAAANPLAHFIEHGGANGLSPHPLFDSQAYLRAHPEAAAMNPLLAHATLPAQATEGGLFGCAS